MKTYLKNLGTWAIAGWIVGGLKVEVKPNHPDAPPIKCRAIEYYCGYKGYSLELAKDEKILDRWMDNIIRHRQANYGAAGNRMRHGLNVCYRLVPPLRDSNLRDQAYKLLAIKMAHEIRVIFPEYKTCKCCNQPISDKAIMQQKDHEKVRKNTIRQVHRRVERWIKGVERLPRIRIINTVEPGLDVVKISCQEPGCKEELIFVKTPTFSSQDFAKLNHTFKVVDGRFLCEQHSTCGRV